MTSSHDFVYPGTTHHRPDIAVHITPRTLVTDVTIVSPTSIPGEAARKAADEKIAHHKPAVEQLDHIFVPFACEVYGLRDKRCHEFVAKIAASLPVHLRRQFKFEMIHVVSSQLAIGRAETVNCALTLYLSRCRR